MVLLKTCVFWSLPPICMDAQPNLPGGTAKFSWTSNGIRIDAQQMLHGKTKKFVWTQNLSIFGQKNLYIYLYIFKVLFVAEA